MNRRLAEAVIAAFRCDRAETIRMQFASFDDRDWLRSWDWLHTSGLALYFYARARMLGIEDLIPERLLHELEKNHADNRMRCAAQFDEFVKINMEFQRAKLSYANLKGFTLAQNSYSDPTYRYQHDLDFLISQRDAEVCRQVLEQNGYQLARAHEGNWEFRAGRAQVITMRDLYKVRLQRSLDVRFLSEKEEDELHRDRDRISRIQLQVWNGFEFPALSERDKFAAQALHLFKHFNTSWTRAAWMLEYSTAIRSHQGDEAFWQEIAEDIADAPETKIGIGIASLVSSRAFGVTLPARLLSCTVGELPQQVGLWVDHYQDDLVYQEPPGSKLYLLLQDVLLQECPNLWSQKRKPLFPLHRPPTIMPASRSDGVWLQARITWIQWFFILKRLYFHVSEGLRYKIEAARWKRFVAGSADTRLHPRRQAIVDDEA